MNTRDASDSNVPQNRREPDSSAHASKSYTYDSLCGSSPQFRLLTLAPAEAEDATVHCSLQTVSLEDGREYEVSFHTFGLPALGRKIHGIEEAHQVHSTKFLPGAFVHLGRCAGKAPHLYRWQSVRSDPKSRPCTSTPETSFNSSHPMDRCNLY